MEKKKLQQELNALYRYKKKQENNIMKGKYKGCDIECGFYSCDVKNLTRHVLMRVLDGLRE